MSNPTIGFIGYGNMAQAIAEGLVAAGAIDGTDIVACAPRITTNWRKPRRRLVPHRCAPLPKSQTRPTLSSSPSNRTRSKASSNQSPARSPTKAHSSYPLRQAGISPNTVNCSAPISARCTSSAPFRTRRWPSAKACSSRKPTTR